MFNQTLFQITNILALFNKKKVEIQNFGILLLTVGQQFNIDWNGNARGSQISGVVPNLLNTRSENKAIRYVT